MVWAEPLSSPVALLLLVILRLPLKVIGGFSNWKPAPIVRGPLTVSDASFFLLLASILITSSNFNLVFAVESKIWIRLLDTSSHLSPSDSSSTPLIYTFVRPFLT